MKSIEAQKLINRISKDLIKSGIVKENLVKELTELREHALEEKDPTVTKVLRLTYEHIGTYGTFNIPIPQDELVDEEGEAVEQEPLAADDLDSRKESLDFLLSLIAGSDKPENREDIKEYRDALLAFEG